MNAAMTTLAALLSGVVSSHAGEKASVNAPV